MWMRSFFIMGGHALLINFTYIHTTRTNKIFSLIICNKQDGWFPPAYVTLVQQQPAQPPQQQQQQRPVATNNNAFGIPLPQHINKLNEFVYVLGKGDICVGLYVCNGWFWYTVLRACCYSSSPKGFLKFLLEKICQQWGCVKVVAVISRNVLRMFHTPWSYT